MVEDRGQRAEGRGQRAEGRFRISARRGVTLLEVLISIGVMAIGLLGVAALIPIGSFAVNETAKADRSAALGRAACHEVRVRRMLEQYRGDGSVPPQAQWCLAQFGIALDDNPATGSLDIRQRCLIGQPFAIDPLFATNAAAQESPSYYSVFPFDQVESADPQYAIINLLQYQPRLARLQLDFFGHSDLRMTNPTNPSHPYYFNGSNAEKAVWSRRQFPVVDRLFTWRDDLIFDVDADDADRRARQSYLWSNGAVAAGPLRADDPDYTVLSSQNALRAEAANNYTWMLTAVPDPNELPNPLPYPAPALPPTNPANYPTLLLNLNALTNFRQKTYTVSVVTFYKRDYFLDSRAPAPSERFADIEFGGTGIGGGDAELRIWDFRISSYENAKEYLKVKVGEWIMVSGFVRDAKLNAIFDQDLDGDHDDDIDIIANSGHRRIAKWYKVIRVDDEIEEKSIDGKDYYTRGITLSGPDWDPDWQDLSKGINPLRFYHANGAQSGAYPNQPRATIIDGAIGVYTTTVTLE